MIEFPFFNAILGAFGSMQGAPRPMFGRCPPGSHQKPQQPRPCLHCGKKHTGKRPWCSAEHKALWQAENPGNGRYVHERWGEIRPEKLAKTLGRQTTHRVWLCEGGDYMVKGSPAGARDYELHRFDGDSFWLLGIFDCLINAQRAAAQHMRGKPITIGGVA